MSNLSIPQPIIPPTSQETIDKIRILEADRLLAPQVPFVTEHVFHAGLYSRTIRIPAGTLLTNVLIKRPTLLIVSGHCHMYVGDQWVELTGYHVIQGSAGRKSVCVTETSTEFTMVFPTSATTVEEAEAEFTDEAESLLSHRQGSDIVMTEAACLESLPQPRS